MLPPPTANDKPPRGTEYVPPTHGDLDYGMADEWKFREERGCVVRRIRYAAVFVHGMSCKSVSVSPVRLMVE